MRYENFRPERPFDFSKTLKISVAASTEQWMGRGRRPHAKWMGSDFAPFERYLQVISFRFRPDGLVGGRDAFEALVNIGVSAAIFGVVKVRPTGRHCVFHGSRFYAVLSTFAAFDGYLCSNIVTAILQYENTSRL